MDIEGMEKCTISYSKKHGKERYKMRRTFRHMLACLLALSMALVLNAALADTTVTSAEELAAAVNNGGTVILGADITGSITIPQGVTVTLNLNGHTLTNTDGQHTITNNGTLTITGSGTVDNVSHAKGAVYNNAGATATLEGGTYTRSKENGQNSENNGGNSWYTIKNFGTMTIKNDVTVEQNGKYSSLIANGWQNGSAAGSNGEPSVPDGGAKLTIEGGTFSGGLNTIKNDDYGTLTISGGTFTNYAQAALLNWNVATVSGGEFSGGTSAILNGKLDDTMDKGKLTITGGFFQGDQYFLMRMSSSESVGTVTITGGEFEGGMNLSTTGGGTVSITGGSFTTEPEEWTVGSKTNLNVSGGRYTSAVPDQYIVEGSTSVSLTESNDSTAYYIGTPEQVASEMSEAAAGDTITVLAGSLTLSNPAVGVTIVNNGDGQVSAGGQTVAKGSSVTIAPAATSTPAATAKPVETPAPATSVPKTGDTSQPLLWAALLLISAGVAVGFLFMKKRYQ